MKYPPVVSTLQEWLDGKIGAQGLDAVSCAFYVLSLLQGEQTDEPEAYCQFPHSKQVVDEPGLSCWPRDGWSTWGFEDTLAAKSLLAPVQGYELEHLGNELSPHLKNIQSEDQISNVAQHCLCTKQNYSLSAGNEIGNCESFSGVNLCNDAGSIGEQSNPLEANESACVGFFKHKLEGRGLATKTGSPFMAEAMKKHEKEEFLAGNRRSLFSHDENLVWGDNTNGPGMSWNVVGDKSSPNFTNIFKQGTQVPGIRELWETDTLFKQFKGSVPLSMPCVGTGDEICVEGLSDKNEDDRSLAQLIAKFDHSIAAIWNLGTSRPLQYDIIDDQPEFSWDIHNLLSSSQDDVIKLELKSFDDSEPIPEENSFIHCGTNITSSIWSDQSFLGNSAGQDDSSTKFVDEGVSMLDGCVNEDHSDLCCKLKVLLASDGLLQNEFSLFGWRSGTIGTSVKEPDNSAGNFIQKVPEECSDSFWSKIQSFPSFFSDVSFQEQFCGEGNVEDANRANPLDENSCMISCSPCPVSLFGNGSLKNCQNVIGNGDRNFNTLNHNREDSSFTEVIPQYSGGKKVVNDTKASYSDEMKQPLGGADETPEENKNNEETSEKKEEEEDLLTSARTHFRPIHQDLVDPHNNPGTHYADGTTFLITSSFMDVPFKRSESGTLFLESNDARDTPKIYMEYKEKAGNNIRGSRFSKDNNTGSRGAFIPKFCVHQIEKYCQTEESDEISEELNFKRIKRDEDKNYLFFSEEEIVKSVADYLDDDFGKFEDFDCKDNQHDVGMNDTLTLNMRNEEISKSFESETYIWNKAGCKCNNNYLFSSKNNSLGIFGASVLSEKEGLWSLGSALSCQSQYSIWSCSPVFGPPGTPLGSPLLDLCTSCESASLCERRERCALREELRSELSADGEQLLSDLRSLQHMQFEGGGGSEHGLLNREPLSP